MKEMWAKLCRVMAKLCHISIFVTLAFISGCDSTPADTPAESDSPVMRWDFHPEASEWTKAVLNALQTHGAPLAQIVPSDIDVFCPAYPEKDANARRAFWAGLFSALAKHESTWNPEASGGGGRWIGLLQISPRTADYYGCQARSVAELKDGPANLACAVRIATVQVERDSMVAGGGARGVGRDWAPFRSSQKREDMAAWTRAQSYCQ